MKRLKHKKVTMVPIPEEYLPDFWNQISYEYTEVTLTCLLPNGIIVLLKVKYNDTLEDIKADLWEKACKLPLYGKLQPMSQYVFKIVNSMAEEEELNDESCRLCDIKHTGGVFIVSERTFSSGDDTINFTIGNLIGKGLHDFGALASSEINDFRLNMRRMAEQIAKKRNQWSFKEKLLYQFPPRMSEATSALLRNISKVLVKIYWDSQYESPDGERFDKQAVLPTSYLFDVLSDTKPTELIKLFFSKKVITFNPEIKNKRVSDYVLKICGRDEYLLGDHPLKQFQYIQDCFSEHITPSLLIVHTNRIPVASFDYKCIDGYNGTLRKKKNAQSSWDIMDNYCITICTASKLNCDTRKPLDIGIQVGLFHGGKSLCQPVKREEKLDLEKCEINFDITREFDIQVCNIPRNAKLCFVVYEVNSKGTRSRKPKDPKNGRINPLAWANTSVFDYKGQLRTGAMTLYMWTYAEDMMSDDVLHPLGTVASNPNTNYCTALTLVFESFTYDQTIIYPTMESILKYAKSVEEENLCEIPDIETLENCKRLISDMDNFNDMHEQERKKLWKHRKFWMKKMPQSLPKLLLCIDWDKRDEVSQAIALLRKWPKLPVEKSLELLDYAYPDQEVRRFAVQECLREVSNEDLLLYLLQLVQAVKHELYLECDLVSFLIERALTNQKIGHYLFWHLRSEMKVPSVLVRFGLILEAYCRGSQEYIPTLQKQLRSIEKLKKCSEIVKTCKDKERSVAALKDYLNNHDDNDNVRSLLDPSYVCSRIKVEECRVMDSKMKPLWIVYENSDTYGEDIYIIFKNGDDLRQDMLTLQMLKIMDRLWKKEGLDLRLNPYNCISLGQRLGMIQVVLNAETIASIQTKSVVQPLYKERILTWLRENHEGEKDLSKAIEEFTLSCAGYCVATYVLGIADRHSDNIMIKKTGQLFHIDFGHILGHFKEKFGIRRERVPFVLTHDFVHVINKGQTGNTSALEFRIFQECCEKAFMILRKHGNLILSLFAMMISTGLPELSSEKDLQYLRETLALSKPDEEALDHFKAKFQDALKNSWQTSIQWSIHNFKH